MRWARLVLVTFVSACGAVAERPDDARPEPAASRDAPAVASPRRSANRRRATAPAEPAAATSTATPDATDPAPPAGTLVRGRVEDADGAPLAHAHVVAFLGVGHPDARTDADGRFSIAIGDPTGAVRCVAWDDDHAVVVGPWRELREGEQADAGTLRCGRAARIEGRLVGPDGRNVSGRVSVESSDTLGPETLALLRRCMDLERIRVDDCSCGTCEKLSIRVLPAGRYVLRADDDGEPVTVEAPADGVVLHAPPRGPWTFDVDVRVLEWDGTPAADCVPRAVPGYDFSHVTQSCRTDAASATLHVVSDESPSIEIVAETPDGRRASQSVSAGASPIELTLPRYAASERRSIRGTVTFGGRAVRFSSDSSGEMHGMRVYVEASATGDGYGPGYGKGTTTGPDGTFAIDGLDPGEYALWARPRDTWGDVPAFAAARVVADAGRDDVVVEMPASRTRRFRIVAPAGLGSIDECDVSVAGPDDDEDCADSDLTGDELLVTGLRDGVAYSMSVRVRCGAAWTQPARVAAFTAGSETLSVLLDAGLRITGRVVRADGTPVVAANVWAERDDAGERDAYTDLDGRFSIEGLEPGPWTLKAWTPGLWAGDDGIAVDAGTANLRVRLDAER